MTQTNRKSLYLKPGEKLPETVLCELKNANEQMHRTKNFNEYCNKIQKIFSLPDYKTLNESQKYYLGGFLEGEASVCVGAKKGKNTRFGAYFDPAFNVTQHVNGVKHLFECLCLFKTGRIRHKGGSNATLVFEIDTRRSLQEKLVPFYKEYVIPLACEAKKRRFEQFCYMLDAFDRKKHLEFDSFVYELAPIWDDLRMQKGQSNETFKSLEDFQHYCLNFREEKAAAEGENEA